MCWAAVAAGVPIELRFDPSHAICWAAAVDAYDGRMKDLIHALKYERRRSIAPRLGALMRERGARLLRDADGVIPVPLHPRREYSRGFNQAHDLAVHLGLPVMPLLKRIVFTQSQIDLPRDQRRQNVAGAFGLQTSAFGRQPSGSSRVPRIVVVVDDVCTTGATLEACARVLKAAGVKEVRALTAARVVNGRH